MKTVVSINQVTKTFGDVCAVSSATLSIQESESVAIIGPSGSGKSTLLRIIAGLVKPDTGTIEINGQSYPEQGQSKVGMVFQEGFLFDHLTVSDNIMLAPKVVLRLDKKEREKRCKELLEMVGLEEKRMAFPLTLSGGERQRVAIARALAMNPSILLFDEPTSALDVDATEQLITIIKKLQQAMKTMLIVTHDLQFAMKCSRRLLFMEKSSIIVDEKTDTYNQSINERFLEFIAKR